MIKCRYCTTEMEKVYSFSEETSMQRFRCPNCGAETAEKEIVYDEEGYLPGRRQKRNGRKENKATPHDSDGGKSA